MNNMDVKPTAVGVYKLHYSQSLAEDFSDDYGINPDGTRFSYWDGEAFKVTGRTVAEAQCHGWSVSGDVYDAKVVTGWEGPVA